MRPRHGAKNIVRAASFYQAALGVADFVFNFNKNDPMVGLKIFGAAKSMFNMMKSCFTGETKLIARGTWGTG